MERHCNAFPPPLSLPVAPQAITSLSLLQALTITSARRGSVRRPAAAGAQPANPAIVALRTPPSMSLIWPEALRCPTSSAAIPSDAADSNSPHTMNPSINAPRGRRRSFSHCPPLALDFLPPLPHLVSLELNGYGSTGLAQLPGSFMARLSRLALIGMADATPLQAHWSELRHLSDLVLDGCVGVEPLLATISDLQVRTGSIDLNPTFKICFFNQAHFTRTSALYSPVLAHFLFYLSSAQALTLLRTANLGFAWWASAAQSPSSRLWCLKGLRSLDISGNNW